MARKKRTPPKVDPDIAQAVEHLSPTDHQTLVGYAAQRVQLLARNGHPVSNDEARILVHDAIVDTLTGVAHWNRGRHRDLRFHLCGVIRTVTSNLWRRARKLEHVSLDHTADDSALAESVRAAALSEHAPVDDRLHAEQVWNLISKRAANDNDVLALVAAYRDGADKPIDIVEAHTLTRGQYLNARRRLARILATMPVDLEAPRGPPANDGVRKHQRPEGASARPARPANDEVPHASTRSQDPMKSRPRPRIAKPTTARTSAHSTRVHTPPSPAPAPPRPRACSAAGLRLSLFANQLAVDDFDDFDDQDTLVADARTYPLDTRAELPADAPSPNLEDTLELDDDERTGHV